MSGGTSWVILLVVLAGLGGASVLIAKKRRDGLRAWSLREGMQFLPDAEGIVQALSSFMLIGRSRRRKGYNALTSGSGADERWIFDFRYRVGGGKNSNTYRQTVVAFPYLDVNLPAFELRPEHLLHKIGATLGFQDIDIDHHPRFSERILLRGQDEQSIHQLFDTGVADAFMNTPPVCVEGAGSCILVYKHRHVVSVRKIADFVSRAERLRDAIVARAVELGWNQTQAAEMVAV